MPSYDPLPAAYMLVWIPITRPTRTLLAREYCDKLRIQTETCSAITYVKENGALRPAMCMSANCMPYASLSEQ